MTRTYTELSKLKTFIDRYEYLRLNGSVGKETFGYDRYINQQFYQSSEWNKVRREVILRDKGCDLGVDGFELHGKLIIHHINPITYDDIVKKEPWIFDPEFLITTCHNTHNAIHYGDRSLLLEGPIVRLPNDTCPWK